MGVGDIVKGHVNELLGLNKDISKARMDICRKCPLFLNELGGICNPRLYLNVETGDVSTVKMDGYVNGCGCRLSAKTRLSGSKCPNGKW